MRCYKLILVGFLLGATSCAQFGTYMENRALDLADSFMLRVGYGLGTHVSVQITRIGPSVMFGISNFTKFGFIGREFVYSEEFLGGFGIIGLHFREVDSTVGGQDYYYNFGSFFKKSEMTAAGFFLSDGFYNLLGVASSSNGANIFYRDYNPNQIKHLFWIEADVCLFADVNAGFNPYEFADFMLGFFTIDISGDDKPLTAEPEKPGERE